VPIALALADADTRLVATPLAPRAMASDHVVEWTRALRDRGGNALRTLAACQGGADDPLATVAATQTFVTGRVAITEPVAGARAVEGQPVRLSATASAALGLVDLTFRLDGQPVGTVTRPRSRGRRRRCCRAARTRRPGG
jgi:hypothetical protein